MTTSGRTYTAARAAPAPDPEAAKPDCEDHGASVRQMQHCEEHRDAMSTVWQTGGGRPFTTYENCERFRSFAYVQHNLR
jgi:hypothetical protein